MNATNQQIRKKWIDESHDDTEAIRKLVGEALPGCASVLVLRGDHQTISLDDLLALGRCGGSFLELSKLLATLEEVPLGDRALPQDPGEAPDFVPLQGMRLIDVFRLIAKFGQTRNPFQPKHRHAGCDLGFAEQTLVRIGPRSFGETQGRVD
eukprot:Sro374_g129330.1 n/a (152) ;mRNA; r:66074-66529